MKEVLDFVIDLLPRLAAMTACIVFWTVLARFSVRTVSICSMSVEAIHLAFRLVFPSVFRRQPSGQYLRFVGVFITAEFITVLALIIPLVYSLCSPRTVYPAGAYGLSIAAAPEPVEVPRPPAIDWYWAGSAFVCFLLMFAVIMQLG
jgi:hypothetical protein